jgi:hypothetical protein
VGLPVELEKGRQGQFEIIVNGRLVASRKGGLLAKILNRPWPDGDDVVAAVRDTLQQEGVALTRG